MLFSSDLAIAYFVNLPNVFVTDILKFERFSEMKRLSTIVNVVTLCVIIAVFVVLVVSGKINGR